MSDEHRNENRKINGRKKRIVDAFRALRSRWLEYRTESIDRRLGATTLQHQRTE